MRTIEEQPLVARTGWIQAGQSRTRKTSRHSGTAPTARCSSEKTRPFQSPPNVPLQLIPFLDDIAELLAANVKNELSRKSNHAFQ